MTQFFCILIDTSMSEFSLDAYVVNETPTPTPTPEPKPELEPEVDDGHWIVNTLADPRVLQVFGMIVQLYSALIVASAIMTRTGPC